MQDFEKLGVFYLGREFDPSSGKTGESLVLYDSKDLTTHAVCFGMTGSGKTGLCLGLLEEAAIDGIPAVVIDPKGDITNLLLTFPGLSAAEFRPWINEDDARSKGVSPDEYAAGQAELWKKGLAEWGEDAERIRRLKAAADFAIYTPGSTAGLPVSIANSFSAPSQAIVDDPESLRERVNGAVSALLGMIGVEADPIRSREHILLATILANAWNQGRDLDLASLIQAVQSPPVARIGVMELESFFPAKDRFGLSMALNNLLASPGFEAWLEGEPLDIAAMLHTPEGKPRISIFYTAHLGDAERMFFVSLLLNQTLGWMRTQSGTTSLRALLYMDEIFGHFPPVANPPSKQPLLTLLKQARAFGLGVVLATQNPVDLDYKGLSNAGTWFIGRLQTERDRSRVLDGLEGAAAGRFDRARVEQILGQLGSRVFFMNNVHENEPVVFQTRWLLSYLRGPLTRTQIKSLMDGRKTAAGKPAPASVPPARISSGERGARPVLPSEVPQYFAPARNVPAAGAALAYEPRVLGSAQLRFEDSKAQVDVVREVTVLAPFQPGGTAPDWDAGSDTGFGLDELEKDPVEENALFEALPAEASRARSYAAWNRDFATWLYRTQTLTLAKSATLKLTSRADESERDFRARVQQAAREQRDANVERLRKSYGLKAAGIEERIRRAEQAAQREAEQANQQKLQTAVSIGATLLGAFLGRKTVSSGTLGRAGTAIRAGSRTWKETQDIARAKENVEALRAQLAGLDSELTAEIGAIDTSAMAAVEAVESYSIKLKKANIAVRQLALCWIPAGD